MLIGRRLAAAALIPVAGVVALGCGSSIGTTKPNATAPATSATPTTTTTLSNPLSSTSSTAVPATQASDQCTASQLRPSWSGMGNGASGTVYYVVNLLNPSPSACVTGGYVGVSAYDPAGDLIAVSAMREGTGLTPPPTLTIAPGASVHFTVGLPDVDEATGGTQCSVTVGALHLIPPNEKSEVQIATPISAGYYPSLCGSRFVVGALQSDASSN
jgi:hypothetical protein